MKFDSGTCLPINEIFVTIQGEGSFSGTPSIFIRLQFCDVGCHWCDTKHTWLLNEDNIINFEELVTKERDSNKFSWCKIEDIVKYIEVNYPQIKHVVITGGEPCYFNIYLLCDQLEKLGKQVQIETSGTAEIKVTDNVWVTLSPKINMAGGKIVLKNSVARANEIKMPIGKQYDISVLEDFLKEHDYLLTNKIKIWLQPLSTNNTATKICFNEALKNNWNLSIQVHKYINCR